MLLMEVMLALGPTLPPCSYSSSKTRSALVTGWLLNRATCMRLSLASSKRPFEISHFGDSGIKIIVRQRNKVSTPRFTNWIYLMSLRRNW